MCTHLEGLSPGGEMTLASVPSSTGALIAEAEPSFSLATGTSGGTEGRFVSNNQLQLRKLIPIWSNFCTCFFRFPLLPTLLCVQFSLRPYRSDGSLVPLLSSLPGPINTDTVSRHSSSLSVKLTISLSQLDFAPKKRVPSLVRIEAEKVLNPISIREV